MLKHVQYNVGNGKSIFFWHDRWWGPNPLIQSLKGDVIAYTGIDEKVKLSEMIVNGEWNVN